MNTKNVLSWIQKGAIVLGVIVIPLMYSFFYLNAFWDPYERLSDVPVAVVNLDEGAVIGGESINLGDEIADNLAEDGTLGFVFTDEKTAAEGVKGDAYYASITIPKDFSRKAATMEQDTEKLHGTIIYSANQKKNYLAAQILENAMPTIKETVNGEIDETVVATLSDKLNGVPGQLAPLQDGLAQLDDGAAKLESGTDQLADGSAKLAAGAATMNANAPALTKGVSYLKNGTGALSSGLGTLEENNGALNTGAGDVADGAAALSDGVTQYTNGVTAAKTGADTLTSGLAQYTGGVTQSKTGADSLYQGLVATKNGVDQMQMQVQGAVAKMDQTASDETLNALAGGATNLSTGLTQFSAGYDQAMAALNAYKATGNTAYLDAAMNGFAQLNANLPALTQGAAQVDTGVGALTAGMKEVKGNTQALSAGLAQVQQGLGDESNPATLVGGSYALAQGLGTLDANSANLNGGAAALSNGLAILTDNNAALTDGATQLANGSSTLKGGIADYTKGVTQASDGANKIDNGVATISAKIPALTGGMQALDAGMRTFQAGTGQLNEGADHLHSGIDTAKSGVDESVAAAKEELTALTGLSDYAKEPINYETNYVQPVANYGSAFAPYFMGLSLWVGGLMIYFGIYLDYHRKIKALTADSPKFVLRTLFFGLISVLQGLALAAVIIYALHIEVAHPAMLYLSTVLASLVFMTIIQFCIVNLGDIGKFLSLLLLILQLTSCAGTFPIETQSKFFRVINYFLPMTYSTQLFKEAIAGGWGANAWHSTLMLLIFLASFLSLTLLVSHRAIAKDLKRIGREAKAHYAHAHA